jgi:hypothetical protein
MEREIRLTCLRQTAQDRRVTCLTLNASPKERG